MAFKLLGIPCVSVNGKEEALAAFRAATGAAWDQDSGSRSGMAATGLVAELGVPKVLVLNATVMADLGDAVYRWQESGQYPLIVEIPDLAGWPEGRETLVDAIRKAVGIQI